MIKKFLTVFPLAIFQLVIIGMGYYIWQTSNSVIPETSPTLVIIISPTTTPTPTDVIPESISPTPPTLTRVPIYTPTSTPTPNPTNSPTPSSTPVPSPTYTPTLSSTPTLTLTLSPTSLPIGVVVADNLNVRWGPGLEYGYAGALYKDEKVIILGSTPDGSWFKVETTNLRDIWVSAIRIEVIGDSSDIPIVSLPPTPFPTPLFNPPNEARTLELRSISVSGEISPDQGQDYIFFENEKETVFILMFEPNVNQVQFILYDQDQTGQSRVVGVGSHPSSDRDGDFRTGELVWRGGPLVSGKAYYLRIINSSPEDIRYCLATEDVYQWSCAKD